MRFHPSDPGRRRFLRNLTLGAVTLTMGELPVRAADKAVLYRGKGLPRARPESVGIAPAGILGFVDAVNQKVGGLHSFMLLRHGKVAAEGWWAPYEPEYPHMLYSLSKSFTSTAVGLAVTEEKLSIDDKVVSFFPNSLPQAIDPNLSEMRIRHLLTMSSGHDQDTVGRVTSAPDGDWVKAFLALPVEHAPGSKFVYNTGATYMLSAIVQKVTGTKVVDYLKSRLFDPLEIEGETWDVCPKGINTGGWGLNIKTEDIARFGQLYLKKGMWKGRQLVPAAWVAQATTKQISNGDNPESDWNQGYCFQFWRCRHNAFRGDGAFGQFCVVMPDYDAVLAVTSGLGDMQAVLSAAWDHILPALSATDNAAGDKGDDLKRAVKGLSVPPPDGKPSSPTISRVSGKTYHIDANDDKIESVTLTFDKDRSTLTLRDNKGEHPIVSGHTAWIKGVTRLGDDPLAKIGTRGAWADDDTYVVKSCFYETPYILTTTLKFTGDQVAINRKMNVGFGPTERPTLTGHSA